MKRRKNGFTLIEMVVTMAVLSILLAISVFSLVMWQENTRFIRLNQHAETLFVAAQNQLTEYSRSGKLSDFETQITKSDGGYERTLDVTKLTNEQGTAYNKEDVWYESIGKGSDASKYQGELCYVSCKAGDYERYKAGNLSSEGKARGADILFEMLSSYIYDDSILNNSISVEFSPEEGQVFAVCFSDRKSEFEYDEPSVIAGPDFVNVSNREESYRRENMVGYYGADTLAKATGTGDEKPVLADVTLNNEETLNLSFRVAKAPGAAQQLKYNLNVYDKDTKLLVLSMTLDGSQIHNYEARNAISTPVTRFTYDSEGEQTTQEIGNYDILAWIEPDATVRVVLDAADIQATSLLYLNGLQNGLKEENASQTAFAATYSFHRFGVDADNIYCTIQGSGDRYKTTAAKQSNDEAVYFATAKVDVENEGLGTDTSYSYIYTLENGRHLYNVRFVEDLTTAQENQYSDFLESENIVNRFEVSKDIDWNSFVAGGNLYYTKSGNVEMGDVEDAQIMQITAAGASDCARLLTQCDFPSIKQLRYGDTFAGNSVGGLNVANKEISSMSIVETSNVLYGIYSTSTTSNPTTSSLVGGEEPAQTEEDAEKENGLSKERPVGLFVHNYGTITKLNLNQITVEGREKVGAFCGTNRGSLTDLELKSSEQNPSTVTGQENVGGIMGYQENINDSGLYDGNARSPELTNLTNRAKVTGRLYVGGIVGEIHIPADSTQAAVVLDECENYGAIVACNSEAMKDADTVEAKTEPKYLGGIVGYANNEYVDEAGNGVPEYLIISNCSSSPEYSDEDLDLYMERKSGSSDDSMDQITDKSYKGTNLRGVYVGGIVGYNNYGTIEDCNTQAEQGKTGYLFGYQYVGGIVGYNQGPASGIEGGSLLVGSKGANEINVVGWQYVGGISGCNADLLKKENSDEADLDAYGVIQPDTQTNLLVKVSNWENRGVVFAKDSYAGGITGYNVGWIYQCDSKVQNSETSGFFQEAYAGDYAGGIAGYNNGVIGKTERTVSDDGSSSEVKKKYNGTESTICYVTGNNYVGGIVGYNDVDAVVENYGIAGGKIKGNGNFVGGIAGLNVSLNLLMDEDGYAKKIVSKPNEVTGKCFVGGSIGGNILDCSANGDSADTVILSQFETNNFFGKITSEAFAGGFVGYNLMVAKMTGEDIDDLQNALVSEFSDIDADKGKYSNYTPSILPAGMDKGELSAAQLHMMAKVEVLDNLDSRLGIEVTRAKGRMLITGDESTKSHNRLGKITGNVYLGGVVGYNDEGTRLDIRKVTNTTPIQAKLAIPNSAEQPDRTVVDETTGGLVAAKEYNGTDQFTYSYVGGIMGKVSENTHLYQCENGAGASVTSLGTYTGGLAEINEGTIEQCQVSNLGSSSVDYVGGICGLNKKTGVITGCILQDATVSGGNYVGGLVAENFGLIENSVIQNQKNKNLANTTISAAGVDVTDLNETQGIAGCVAAYNAGTISQNTDVKDVKIVSGGNYAGAVVGVNEGNIINGKESGKITVTGSVSGQEYIGGIIGSNRGSTTNTSAAVSAAKTKKSATKVSAAKTKKATTKAAANKTFVDNRVSGYRNEATVTAEYGNAGGILGNNTGHSNVVDCENAGQIIARQKGNAGGITAENNADISNCIDYGKVSAPNGDCGGIAAWNYKGATIDKCQVMSPYKNAYVEFTAKGTVGGVVSHNQGDITAPTLSSVYVYNYTTSKTSDIGVVAGKNYGTGVITLAAGEAVVDCKAETYTDNSNVGGVAGLNLGTITAPKWYQEVELEEGQEDLTNRDFSKPKAMVSADVGYVNDRATVGNLGGVVGKNQGIVENIGVKNGTVTGKLGSSTTGIGGVAGMSVPAGSTTVAGGVTDSSAVTSGETSSSTTDTTTSDDRSAVTDTPRIENCTFDGEVSAAGTYANAIYMGGIVGLNEKGSTIYGCRIGVEYETVVSNGDNRATSNYGYVGGIAGNTYGDVVACDSYHTDGTTVEVLIESNAGQVGGVAGVQQSGAKVTGEQNRRLSTGRDWTVSYYRYINDHAIGGIVGSSYSNEAVEYISNYAEVLYVGTTPADTHYNMARAGVVGRLWPETTESVHFTNCYNYGSVLGKTSMNGKKVTTQGRCGGIIGQLQYAGVTMEACKNYGILQGGHYAGGMIGTIYMPMTDVEILNCENHGNLYGTEAAAGMVASRYKKGSTACDFIFYQCVNTGVIGTNDSAASRSGMGTAQPNDSADTNITGYYVQCQNYGYGTTGSNFSGIQNGIQANTIVDCFDLGGGSFSQTETANIQTGNYFMNQDSFTSDQTAAGNAASTRFNYKNGALYLGANITPVQDLTVLSDGSAGAEEYYGETSEEYEVGGKDEKQNIRYRTYLEMHTKVADYIKSTYCLNNISGKDKLDKPTNISLNYRTTAGYNTLTWNPVEQAYSYEIRYTVTKNDGTTVTKTTEIEGLCRLHIENEELENADKLHVEIRAKDGCGSHVSDWSEMDLKPKEILAAPKYHLEMLYNGANGNICNQGRMIVVLDNAQDYLRNGKKIANIKVNDIGSWTINPEIGYSDTAKTLEKGQKQTRAYAEPIDTTKYAQSSTVANVTYIAGGNVMNTEYNNVVFNGFQGDTTGNLSYSMTISTNYYDTTNYVGYYTQEVMAYDEEVGAVISYSHGLARKDMTGDISLSLSGFPVDLTSREKIWVKNIYWAAQGYTTYCGHEVASQITLEELKALEDDEFYQVQSGDKVTKTTRSIWDGDSLRDGYIIYKNADETYSVYYSALAAGQSSLGNDTSTVGGLKQMTYTRSGKDEDDTAVYTDLNQKVIPVQPKPVIADMTENSKGDYVFTWDVNKNKTEYQNAVYTVELTGTTVDGTTVSLTKPEEIQWENGKGQYSISPQDNWNYKSITLSVSRHGAMAKDNSTTSFPSGAEREFSIRLELPQIVVDEVNHTTDEQGNNNMDELLYQVTWDGVPTAAEQADLGGYLITVTGDKGTKTHYYYVLETGNDIPETIKALTASSNNSVVDVTNTYNENALSAVVNLEDFQNGETISVSVKAVAKNDADIYKDGSEGTSQSQILPDKLSVPKVAGITANRSAEEGTILVSAFDNDGITLSYRDDTGDENARLRIAVAVFDTLPTGTDVEDKGKIINAGDGAQGATGYWNTNAEQLLIGKSAKEYMTGNAKNASCKLTLPAGTTWSDYAGKWLKIALQSTSDSYISSNWTDEDSTDLTRNYMWIQLPKAQLDSTGLIETGESNMEKWTWNNGSWDTAAVSDQQYIAVRTLTFKTQDKAQGYRVQIVGEDQSVHWIYINKNEDGYDISYTETDESDGIADVETDKLNDENYDTGDLDAAKINTTCPENVYTTSVSSLLKGETTKLPYINSNFTLQETDWTTTPANLYATLSLDSDGETFTLALPEVTGYSLGSEKGFTSTGTKYAITEQVAVQAVVYGTENTDNTVNTNNAATGTENNTTNNAANGVAANTEPAYVNSVLGNWSLTSDGKAKIETVETLPQAPTLQQGLDVTEIHGTEDTETTYQFRLKTNNKMAVKILVTDEANNLKDFTYKTIIPESDTTNGTFTLPESSFMDEETGTINKVFVQFAEITEKNLSAWSQQYQLGVDGTLTEAETTEIKAETVSIKEARKMWQEELKADAAQTTEEPELPTTEQPEVTPDPVTTQEETTEITTELTTEQSSTEAVTPDTNDENDTNSTNNEIQDIKEVE